MNEFWFMAALVVTVFLCAATWCFVKDLFDRWLNNDWCRHNWGAWETKEGNSLQMRFCKKCNMMEKRVP